MFFKNIRTFFWNFNDDPPDNKSVSSPPVIFSITDKFLQETSISYSSRDRFKITKQKPCLSTGLLFCGTNFQLGQSVVDCFEGVVDLVAESGHNDDHDDGDECENDRVLNETLAFFFGSE